MMMNRDKLGFWARFIAIFLALVFVSSFIFLGIGGNVSYNLLDLVGGGQNEQTQIQDTTDEQIASAEENLQENPDDPQATLQLASLYIQGTRYEDAERVLMDGRENEPENADFASLLGQTYEQQAAAAGEDGSEGLYTDAAEQYVAAAEIELENADFQVLAGQAYEQSGDVGRAIQYYNGYLDIEPDGQNSEAVRQRVEELLAPEETTTASAAPENSTGDAAGVGGGGVSE